MTAGTAAEDTFDRDTGFPRLTEEQLELLESVGERRAVSTGDMLFRAGDATYDFFVVLSGRVAIVDDLGCDTERVIGVHGPGRFLGELSLITGEPVYLTAVVREEGEVIVVAREALQRLVSANRQLGDLVLSAYIARRELLIGLGSGARLIGSSLSPETRRLREFLTRNRIPHTFLDLEHDAQADALIRGLGIPPGD